ncbi:MAG: DNA helicase RecG, partial [Nitrospinaceae bacterium]|nr:DNA helicase RecG [Nitrospinaceae bacterium]
ATLERNREKSAVPLTHLTGVGPAVLQRLQKMDLESVEDLLFRLPHRYEDRREITKISRLQDGIQQVFCGEILAAGEMMTRR